MFTHSKNIYTIWFILWMTTTIYRTPFDCLVIVATQETLLWKNLHEKLKVFHIMFVQLLFVTTRWYRKNVLIILLNIVFDTIRVTENEYGNKLLQNRQKLTNNWRGRQRTSKENEPLLCILLNPSTIRKNH